MYDSAGQLIENPIAKRAGGKTENQLWTCSLKEEKQQTEDHTEQLNNNYRSHYTRRDKPDGPPWLAFAVIDFKTEQSLTKRYTVLRQGKPA